MAESRVKRVFVAIVLLGGILQVPSVNAGGQELTVLDGVPIEICAPDPSWPGFRTAEEAAAASDDAPVCEVSSDMVEIVPVVIGNPPLGAPTPTARDLAAGANTGYHWNGAQTSNRYKGGQATIEVTDPSVTHDGSVNEFVVSRVMGKKFTGSNWLEVGWAEVSWKDDKPYVYTFSTSDGAWHFYGVAYPLQRGSHYKFRVERCSIDGTFKTCGYIYWSNSWQLLDKSTHGCVYDGGTDGERCFIEEYTEVYSQDSTPHPQLTAANTSINWSATKIRDGSSWVTWNDSSYPSSEGSDTPYSVCWTDMDWTFRVKKGTC